MEPISLLGVLKHYVDVFLLTIVLVMSSIMICFATEIMVKAMNDLTIWVDPCDCGRCHRVARHRPKACVKRWNEDSISRRVAKGHPVVSILLIAISYCTKMNP